MAVKVTKKVKYAMALRISESKHQEGYILHGVSCFLKSAQLSHYAALLL